MKISISIALTPSPLPHVMFAGAFERRCEQLAAMGYDGLDLFIPDPEHADLSAIRAALDRCGLQVTMLAAAADMMADGLFLNRPARLSELLQRSHRHLDMCAALKAMPTVGFLRGSDDGRSADSLECMADGLAAYCELAAQKGVEVLLEPIERHEINTVNTVSAALDLRGRSGNPANLKLLLDLFHMNIEEPSLFGALFTAGRLIRHVHFVENTRTIPGTGCLPLGEVVSCLHAVGYDQFLGIEAVPGSDPEREAQDALLYTRCLLAGRTVPAYSGF